MLCEPPSPGSKPHRSPGGQPGNLNARSSPCALKHGFYSRQIKKADLADLDSFQFAGLDDEITILRVYLRRLIELGKDIDAFEGMLSQVRGMCMASASLNRLLRTQKLIAPPEDEKYDLMEQAIAETLSELQAKYSSEGDPPAQAGQIG